MTVRVDIAELIVERSDATDRSDERRLRAQLGARLDGAGVPRAAEVAAAIVAELRERDEW